LDKLKPTLREPYEPPQIRRIKIIPEELAAAGCKRIMITPNVCRVGVRLINRLRGS